MKRLLILAVLVAGGCTTRQQVDSVVELWDVGNVFVQPKQTLIFSLRADGTVIAREDTSGRPNLDLTLTQVVAARPIVGQIDRLEARRALHRIEKTGILKADRYSGLITVDGPCVRLAFRSAAGSNEVSNVALDDTIYHAHVNDPKRRDFMQMWDKIASVLRSVHVQEWKPVSPKDGVLTEIPWKQETEKRGPNNTSDGTRQPAHGSPRPSR